jgi:hypothetical protein
MLSVKLCSILLLSGKRRIRELAKKQKVGNNAPQAIRECLGSPTVMYWSYLLSFAHRIIANLITTIISRQFDMYALLLYILNNSLVRSAVPSLQQLKREITFGGFLLGGTW